MKKKTLTDSEKKARERIKQGLIHLALEASQLAYIAMTEKSIVVDNPFDQLIYTLEAMKRNAIEEEAH